MMREILLVLSIQIIKSGYTESQFNSQLITGKGGAVSAESTKCSQLGADILKDGGNAMDAAVGATLCQGVIYPFASGIGGGGFLLVKRVNDTTGKFIDFREKAPRNANETMFVDQSEKSSLGGLSVAVPGEVLGLWEAHKLYGQQNWSNILYKVINIANNYIVPYQVPLRLQRRQALIAKGSALHDLFYNFEEDRFVKEGELLKLTKLVETLTKIAEEGPKAFYNGTIARRLVKTINQQGGVVTEQDFRDYNVEISDALHGTYLGRDIYFPTSPASGAVSYHILKILEAIKPSGPLTAEIAHQLIEAWKFGFAGRAELGDTNNDSKVINFLMDQTEIVANMNSIKNVTQANPKYYYRNLQPVLNNNPHGTSHVNVIDKDGLTVSVTSTINLEFGSKVLCPLTGILLNNQMDDFSTPGQSNFFGLAPSPSNFIKPGKRPLSSMSPMIIQDNRTIYAVGGSGGSRIITGLTQVLLNHFHLQYPLDKAINLGRFHNQLSPSSTRIESNAITADLESQLKLRHHILETMTYPESAISIVQATLINHLSYNPPYPNLEFQAVSDHRKNGTAVVVYPSHQ